MGFVDFTYFLFEYTGSKIFEAFDYVLHPPTVEQLNDGLLGKRKRNMRKQKPWYKRMKQRLGLGNQFEVDEEFTFKRPTAPAPRPGLSLASSIKVPVPSKTPAVVPQPSTSSASSSSSATPLDPESFTKLQSELARLRAEIAKVMSKDDAAAEMPGPSSPPQPPVEPSDDQSSDLPAACADSASSVDDHPSIPAPPPPPPPPPMAGSRGAHRRGARTKASASAIEEADVEMLHSSGGIVPKRMLRPQSAGSISVGEIVSKQGSLRKVDMKRSPGGTPARTPASKSEASMSSQDMIAQALKKKFGQVHRSVKSPATPESPADKENVHNFSRKQSAVDLSWDEDTGSR